MKQIRAQNFFLCALFLIIVAFDQFTKSWAGNINEPVQFLFFAFERFFNPGISFGQFSEGSPFIRVVFLSTFFGVVLLISTLIIFYLFNREKLFPLRLSIVTFIAGVTGNGIDRILFGKVTDFIILDFFNSVVFNVADIFLLIGACLTVFYIFSLGPYIWPEEENRKFKLIKPAFQVRFSLKLLMLTFFSNLLMAIFSFTIINTLITNKNFKDEVSGYIVLGFLSIVILFSLITFIFGIYISHRHTGPIFAFSRFLKDFCKNPNASLKLREQDEHKELEDLAFFIKENFKNKNV